MIYEGLDRYQFQPWHVRCVRWLRWKPLAFVSFLWNLARWCLSGMQPDTDWTDDDGRLIRRGTRGDAIELMWDIAMSLSDFDMGAYYSHSEVMAELREKYGAEK